MFKAKYKGKIVTVYDVEKKYGYTNYNEKTAYMPVITWFLIGIENSFVWVKARECEPVE